MVGVVDLMEAKQRARDAEMDLVEISPDSNPPVCRILDFGKWKYEQSKKDKAQRAKTKSADLKEIRLGRSMKIDPHDLQIRLTQARKFLIDGHKVQIVQNFRGREMLHKQRGMERMQQIIEEMSDIAKVEMPPRQAGRRMTMMLAPVKSKVEQYKQRKEAETQQKSNEEAAPVTETTPPSTPEIQVDQESDDETKESASPVTASSTQAE